MSKNTPIDLKKIETARPGPSDAAPSRELLVRVQVLLDRANFSPGEIDGRDGDNLQRALVAYRQSQQLDGNARMDDTTLQRLVDRDNLQILQRYTITPEDERGPFLPSVPKDFQKLAKLKHIGYTNPEEALSEKFHMSPALLHELNPNTDFSKAGTSITVTRPGTRGIGKVARIEVDKSANQLRAYDSTGRVIAAYPATVGSTERPAPSGKATIISVADDPAYTYDPRRETFGPRSAGVLKIAAGPNSPVGSTWIALSIETYGIHGAPDPELVGKTASHGCVRLTNWDAAALGKAVKNGTSVEFVGQTKPKAT